MSASGPRSPESNPRKSMPLAAGLRLGPYEILAPLGAGGMGEVYRARDSKLARDIAVKVLPAGTTSDPAALARFEREARAVAQRSHPNILSIYDFGSADGVAYAAMELLSGETLRQRLDRGPFPESGRSRSAATSRWDSPPLKRRESSIATSSRTTPDLPSAAW